MAVTKAISTKGFSGYSSVEARSTSV